METHKADRGSHLVWRDWLQLFLVQIQYRFSKIVQLKRGSSLTCWTTYYLTATSPFFRVAASSAVSRRTRAGMKSSATDLEAHCTNYLFAPLLNL